MRLIIVLTVVMMVLVLSVFGLSPLYASDGQSRRIYRYEDKLQPEQVWNTGGLYRDV